MLSNNQILIFKNLSILLTKSLNQLFYGIFNLLRKTTEYKFMINNQIIQTLYRHLNFKWKVIFYWSHICQLNKFF
jgi:hypothetical protein